MCFTTCDPVPDKPTQHAHMLRRACGYALAIKGIDTRTLQAYLGHRSITSPRAMPRQGARANKPDGWRTPLAFAGNDESTDRPAA